MKMLYVANLLNRVNNFCMSNLMAARESGIEFHIASNWQNYDNEEMKRDEEKYGIKIYQIDFIRTPYNPKNIKAYKQLCKLVEQEKYDVIHCNTPIGGVCGRLVGKKYNVSRIIYQAHGFHFYKGAPLLNWMLYYPIEKWLARYTDTLITINQEDYNLAKRKMKMRNNGEVYYVPGVGIDIMQYDLSARFRNIKREELGITDEQIAIISMGDLIERKNYNVAVRSIAKANNKLLQYYICGCGPEEEALKRLAIDLGISEQVHFLGFRTDIKELLSAMDVFLFTTKQEGLPRSMMEAMASGLPCVVSRIRGNTDLIDNSYGGFLCDTNDVSGYADKLNLLASDKNMRIQMGNNNLCSIHKFEVSTVVIEIEKIYEMYNIRINNK